MSTQQKVYQDVEVKDSQQISDKPKDSQGISTAAWDDLKSQVDDDIIARWERMQLELKQKMVTADSSVVKSALRRDKNQTFYIGGVDVSFIKDNNEDACAALVILSFPELKVVYKRLEMTKITAPYVPGYLAFREVNPILHLYNTMLKNAPQYKPDVILVDGNGQLHPREFGLACHLGVVLQLPCIGVAKTLIHVDGVEDIITHKERKVHLEGKGSMFEMKTDSGRTLGMALRSTDLSRNPIYVSVGHNICLTSAVALVEQCCKYRIPEPTRLNFSFEELLHGHCTETHTAGVAVKHEGLDFVCYAQHRFSGQYLNKCIEGCLMHVYYRWEMSKFRYLLLLLFPLLLLLLVGHIALVKWFGDLCKVRDEYPVNPRKDFTSITVLCRGHGTKALIFSECDFIPEMTYPRYFISKVPKYTSTGLISNYTCSVAAVL